MTIPHPGTRTVETIIRAATLRVPGITPAIAAALSGFTTHATSETFEMLAKEIEPATFDLAQHVAHAIGRAAMRADPAGRADIAHAIREIATTRPGLALIRHLTG